MPKRKKSISRKRTSKKRQKKRQRKRQRKRQISRKKRKQPSKKSNSWLRSRKILGWNIFVFEYAKKHPEIPGVELFLNAARKWRKMSKAQKNKYDKKAEQENIRLGLI